eukprot:scaffold1328_cov375-Pavlova_lutheri.AAC.9
MASMLTVAKEGSVANASTALLKSTGTCTLNSLDPHSSDTLHSSLRLAPGISGGHACRRRSYNLAISICLALFWIPAPSRPSFSIEAPSRGAWDAPEAAEAEVDALAFEAWRRQLRLGAPPGIQAHLPGVQCFAGPLQEADRTLSAACMAAFRAAMASQSRVAFVDRRFATTVLFPDRKEGRVPVRSDRTPKLKGNEVGFPPLRARPGSLEKGVSSSEGSTVVDGMGSDRISNGLWCSGWEGKGACMV